MIIIVDSREQLPYWSGRECAKATLIVGDYTTAILFNRFHIERKSPQDLYGTITKGNWRFKNELFRARDRNIRMAVYVESSKRAFINKEFPKGDERKFPSTGLEKIIRTLETKYELEFVWCSNREAAKRRVELRLKKEERLTSSRKR